MESLENPMVSGRFGYDFDYMVGKNIKRIKSQEDYICPRCGVDIEDKKQVFLWSDDEWFCEECFVDAILSMSKEDRAEAAGYESCYVEQDMESLKYIPAGLADLFGHEVSTAGEVK